MPSLDTAKWKVKLTWTLVISLSYSFLQSGLAGNRISPYHCQLWDFWEFGVCGCSCCHPPYNGGVYRQDLPLSVGTHIQVVQVCKGRTKWDGFPLRFPTCQCDRDLPSKCRSGENGQGEKKWKEKEMLGLSCRSGIRSQFCRSDKQN